uniref:Ribosomal protein S16 n=1 Tax=Setaria italica TaxID=4555 RepID=K3YK11_SETIT
MLCSSPNGASNEQRTNGTNETGVPACLLELLNKTMPGTKARRSAPPPCSLHSIPSLSRNPRLPPPQKQLRKGEGGEEGAEMVVRIRLARFGCRNRPFYRLMAADSRYPRDGKHLEVLGYYNPLPGIGCPLGHSLQILWSACSFVQEFFLHLQC